MTSPASLIALHDVTKIYGSGEARVTALAGVSTSFCTGEFTAIMGPSGSGKSTLLHMLAGLDSPTSGRITIEGTDITHLADDALARLRHGRIGFVFQAFNLMPTLTARENILLPLRLAGRKPEDSWFDAVVSHLGLGDRLTHLPSQLSGGQQQRVAIARALMSRPAVIVADEPTGNLDSHSSQDVLALLRSCVDNFGQSVIMVTHDRASALVSDRALVLRDGQIVADLAEPSTTGVDAALRGTPATALPRPEGGRP